MSQQFLCYLLKAEGQRDIIVGQSGLGNIWGKNLRPPVNEFLKLHSGLKTEP